MDKIESMQCFVEVVEQGSFTQAAEHLGISRLKVTRLVQELENWLQMRLLHRTTRRVSLTTAGEDVLKYCETILDGVAALERRVNEHQETLLGDIRIATPIGFAQSMLLAVVQQFQALHPKVRVLLQLSDQTAQLVDERIDIAFRHTEQPDEQLIARRMLRIDSVVCATPHYWQQQGMVKQPSDLTQHRCLIHAQQDHWQFVHNHQLLDIKVSGTLYANDMSVLLQAALRGMGVARLPSDLVRTYLADNQLQAVLTEYPVPELSLWAVYLSRSYQRPVVRAFLDFAGACWRDMDALPPSVEGDIDG